MFKLKECKELNDFKDALKLTEKYFEWLKIDLDNMEVSQGVEDFSKTYSDPDGCFVLALNQDNQVVGGVGIKEADDKTCELKRLFVIPEYFGNQLGFKLCSHIIKIASELGYSRIKLDTLKKLTDANKLFTRLGFTEAEPYKNNPDNELVFLELNLEK